VGPAEREGEGDKEGEKEGDIEFNADDVAFSGIVIVNPFLLWCSIGGEETVSRFL
jgi:hypothetical protein